MSPRRALGATSLAVLMAFALSACSLFTDPHRYDNVKAVLEDLRLSQTGDVAHETYYGGGTAGTPCYRALVTGPDAYSSLSDRLKEVGFISESGREWDRSPGSGYQTVIINPESPGDSFPVPDQESFTVKEAGVMVDVC